MMGKPTPSKSRWVKNRPAPSRRFGLWILVLLLGFPHPAAADEKTPPQFTDPFYQELSPDQFLLVEDFSKEGENSLGAPSFLVQPKGAWVRSTYAPEDAVSGKGQSLHLSCWIPGRRALAWATHIEFTDMSQADALAFWFQGTIGSKESIWVSLEDGDGLRKETPVFPFVEPQPARASRWKRVWIPLQAFQGVNLNRLTELKISVRAGFAGWLGHIRLDHVLFSGPRELVFLSIRDNLHGFPGTGGGKERTAALAAMDDRELLTSIAKDTWGYFDHLVDQTHHLVIDHIKLNEPRFVGDYTSPTNVGLYLAACVCAYHLGFISRLDAAGRIQKTLTTLERLDTHQGFFRNYYNTSHVYPTDVFVSSVDNAWLAAGLIIIRTAFKNELAAQASALLNAMNFHYFYDPGVGQLSTGYNIEERDFAKYHYSLLATETRIMSLLAIGKGDIPDGHWFNLYRTPPSVWDWQTQVPQEKKQAAAGIDFQTGFYKYGPRRFVPSWGGSLFEFLMPTLFVPEREWSPLALGLNNKIVSEIHRDYALTERRYPVWGISPCSVARGNRTIYEEFGVKALGVKGYPDAGIITPHASFLALETIPEDAIKNIRTLLTRYDLYGEYGFYDSVTVSSGQVTRQYLALDQAMTLIALTNYLNRGSIQQLFASDPIGRKIKELLKEEEFF